jgi:hypothetical protein
MGKSARSFSLFAVVLVGANSFPPVGRLSPTALTPRVNGKQRLAVCFGVGLSQLHNTGSVRPCVRREQVPGRPSHGHQALCPARAEGCAVSGLAPWRIRVCFCLSASPEEEELWPYCRCLTLLTPPTAHRPTRAQPCPRSSSSFAVSQSVIVRRPLTQPPRLLIFCIHPPPPTHPPAGLDFLRLLPLPLRRFVTRILRVLGVVTGEHNIGFGLDDDAGGGDKETTLRPYLDALNDFRSVVRAAARDSASDSKTMVGGWAQRRSFAWVCMSCVSVCVCVCVRLCVWVWVWVSVRGSASVCACRVRG